MMIRGMEESMGAVGKEEHQFQDISDKVYHEQDKGPDNSWDEIKDKELMDRIINGT